MIRDEGSNQLPHIYDILLEIHPSDIRETVIPKRQQCLPKQQQVYILVLILNFY